MELPRYRGKLWAGAILTALGVLWTGIGAAMAIFPRDEYGGVETGLGNVGLGTAALLLPGVVLLAVGLANRRRAERLRRVAALGAASQRIPVDTVAQDLEVTPSVARKYLLDAVSLGLLSGRIDLEHGVFLSTGAESSIGNVESKCRACGAAATVVTRAGEATICPFCGARN